MKRFLKNNLVAVIAIAVIVAGAGTVYGGLKSQQQDFGANPTGAENPSKTQVLLEGEGYSLSKDQKDDYDLPQKVEKKKNNEVKPYTPQTNTQGSHFTFTPHSTTTPTKIDYSPTIYTNLKDQKVKAGKEISFWVEGKTYTKISIRSSNFKVKMGKDTITGSGSDTHCTYTVTIPKGKNKITIKVTDPLRKKSTSKTFTVTGKKKKKPEEKKYTVTADFSAPDILVDGEALSCSVFCEVTEGDDLSAALKEIDKALSEDGYGISPSGETPTKLSLPNSVTLDLTPEARELYGDEETNPPLEDQDSIKNGIFTDSSAWSIEDAPDTITEDTNLDFVFNLE